MPDDDARLRSVEIDVGVLKQRVEDHEGDIRAFGPLVNEQALLRQSTAREFKSHSKSLDRAHDAIRDLDKRVDEEREERLEAERLAAEALVQAREARDVEIARLEADRLKQNAELRSRLRIAALGLMGVFLTSSGTVVAAIVAVRGGK